MLQLRETRIVRSNHEPVLSSVTINEEGIPLVYEKEDGETKVKPATGAAGEIFAGVSLSRNAPPSSLPNVEETVIPAGLTYTLARTPITGQLLIKVNGAQVTVVPGAPANAGEVQIAGPDLNFAAGTAGHTLTIQYLYTPTTIEARSIIGDVPAGGLPSTALGIVGLLKDAQFGTNKFDASVDWSTALYAKLGNGIFTVGTANDHLVNVVVKNAPNAGNPFLILSINVA